jgi:hypothetical protein
MGSKGRGGRKQLSLSSSSIPLISSTITDSSQGDMSEPFLAEFDPSGLSLTCTLSPSLFDSDFTQDLANLVKRHIILWLQSCKQGQALASPYYIPVTITSETVCQLNLSVSDMAFTITRIYDDEEEVEEDGTGTAPTREASEVLPPNDLLFQGMINIVSALLDRTRSFALDHPAYNKLVTQSDIHTVHTKTYFRSSSARSNLFVTVDPDLLLIDFGVAMHKLYTKANSSSSCAKVGTVAGAFRVPGRRAEASMRPEQGGEGGEAEVEAEREGEAEVEAQGGEAEVKAQGGEGGVEAQGGEGGVEAQGGEGGVELSGDCESVEMTGEEFVQTGYVTDGFVLEGMVRSSVDGIAGPFTFRRNVKIKESFVRDAYVDSKSRWRDLDDYEWRAQLEFESGLADKENQDPGDPGEIGDNGENDSVGSEMDGFYRSYYMQYGDS